MTSAPGRAAGAAIGWRGPAGAHAGCRGGGDKGRRAGSARHRGSAAPPASAPHRPAPPVSTAPCPARCAAAPAAAAPAAPSSGGLPRVPSPRRGAELRGGAGPGVCVCVYAGGELGHLCGNPRGEAGAKKSEAFLGGSRRGAHPSRRSRCFEEQRCISEQTGENFFCGLCSRDCFYRTYSFSDFRMLIEMSLA